MNDGVMLALLPTNGEWCKQPLPHMTLVYAGTIDDVSYTAFGDLCKDALTVVRLLRRPLLLDVTGVEVFGDEQKVDVLRLGPTPDLLTARKIVEYWNASQHPFSPHATVGPEGSVDGEIPTKLYFDRLYASWGPRNLTFRLGSGDY